MAFVALERLINFQEGYRRVFTVGHQQILLIKSSGEGYAIQANCPHKDWSLLSADIEAGVITCPKHHAKFALNSGKHLTPCAISTRPLKIYPAIFEDTHVGVLWQDGD